MPRTGGSYYLPSPPMPLVPNTLAAAEDVNTVFSDIGAALTNSLPTDGSAAMTGNLNMNGHALTGASSLATTGSLSAGSLAVTGTAQVNGALSTYGGIYPNVGLYNIGGISAFSIYNNGGASLINFRANNYIQCDGNLNYYTTGTHIFTGNMQTNGSVTAAYLTSSGNINANSTFTGGAVSVSGAVSASNLTSSGWVTAQSNAMGFITNGADHIVQVFANPFQFYGQAADGTLIWNTPYGYYTVWRMSDGLFYNQRGGMAGYGPYNNVSDGRSKQDVQPVSYGLEEIRRLKPVRFQRHAPEEGDAPPPEVGFVAQDLQQIIPEAVRALGIKLPDGSGGLDSGAPSLGVALEPIVAALCTAVQELDARMAAAG